MPTIDQLEKGGRLVLWIALAAAAALVPIGAYGVAKANARTAEEVRADALKERAAKEAANKPGRLPLVSMGPVLSTMDGATGHAWFTNTWDRSGVLCAYGVVTSEDGTKKTESIPACHEVAAYASNVKMSFLFAGDAVAACSGNRCRLSIKDVPIPAEPAVAKR
jgi:hypothetical protein